MSSYLLRFFAWIKHSSGASCSSPCRRVCPPSDTLVTACPGQGLRDKLRTSEKNAPLVRNVPSNILGNHLSLTQCLHYPGNWSNVCAYLVTVDHWSIEATEQHFRRHSVPRFLVRDNGSQFISEAFKAFAEKYKFYHITSSPYWSQSNGRAEAAVKAAKHIPFTAEDVDVALLSVRNTTPRWTHILPSSASIWPHSSH